MLKDHTSRTQLVVGILMLVGLMTFTQAQPGGQGAPQVVSTANAPQGGERQFQYERPLIGADISFVPSQEDRGTTFKDQGVEKDVLKILADHKFNWIRLRLFVDPELIRAYRLTPIMASHHPMEIAYQQKVRALAHRALTQARDVFDLYWLINSGANTEFPDDLQQCRRKAQENAMAVTFATFKSQVLAYLSVSHREQYDSESVWETVQLTVAEALGSTGART